MLELWTGRRRPVTVRLPYDASHPMVLLFQSGLGMLISQHGQLEEAEQLLSAALHGYRETKGPDGADTRYVEIELAYVYLQTSSFNEAVELLATRTDSNKARVGLARAHIGLEQYAKAESILTTLHEAGVQHENDALVQYIVNEFVKLYEASQQPEKAAQWRARLDQP